MRDKDIPHRSTPPRNNKGVESCDLQDPVEKQLRKQENGYFTITVYACTVCDKIFTKEKNVQKHLLEKHSKETTGKKESEARIKKCVAYDAQEVCNNDKEVANVTKKACKTSLICPESFSSKEKLKIHQMQHKSKFEAKKRNKETFISAHQSIGLVPCSLCNKTFSTNKKLRLHLRKKHQLAEEDQLLKDDVYNTEKQDCHEHTISTDNFDNENAAKTLPLNKVPTVSSIAIENLTESHENSQTFDFKDSNDCCIVGEFHAGASSNNHYEIIDLDTSNINLGVSEIDSKSGTPEFSKKGTADQFDNFKELNTNTPLFSSCQNKLTTNSQNASFLSSYIDGVYCSYCRKSYHNKKLLQLHLKAVHGIMLRLREKREFPCSICNIIFFTKKRLKKHLKYKKHRLAQDQLLKHDVYNTEKQDCDERTISTDDLDNENAVKPLPLNKVPTVSSIAIENLTESYENSQTFDFKDSNDYCIVGQFQAGASSNTHYEITNLDTSNILGDSEIDSNSVTLKFIAKRTADQFDDSKELNSNTPLFSSRQNKLTTNCQNVSFLSSSTDRVNCRYCPMTFHDQKLLQLHLKAMHPDIMRQLEKKKKRNLPCSKKSLKKHERSHSLHSINSKSINGSSNHSLQTNKSTNILKNFKQVIKFSDRFYNYKYNYKCNICGKKFGIENSIKNHMRVAHLT